MLFNSLTSNKLVPSPLLDIAPIWRYSHNISYNTLYSDFRCTRDNTTDYNYDPHSNIQRFSMRAFRFLYTSNAVVYLHCELMVCHRNSANSRCSRGCMNSRRRREANDQLEGSNLYDLSSGGLKGQKRNGGNQEEGKGADSSANVGLIGGLSVVGAVLLLVSVAFVVKVILPHYLPKYRPTVAMETSPPVSMEVNTVNSHEQHVKADDQM